jgi:hypothetical protein
MPSCSRSSFARLLSLALNQIELTIARNLGVSTNEYNAAEQERLALKLAFGCANFP